MCVVWCRARCNTDSDSVTNWGIVLSSCELPVTTHSRRSIRHYIKNNKMLSEHLNNGKKKRR